MTFFFNIQNSIEHLFKEIFYKLTQIFIIAFSSFLAFLNRKKLKKDLKENKFALINYQVKGV